MTEQQRTSTDAARAARWGCSDPEAAAALIGGLSGYPDADWDLLSGAADPDQALRALVGLLGRAGDELAQRISADPEALRCLVAVLGVSEALGEFLLLNPDRWIDVVDAGERPSATEIRERLLRAVGAEPGPSPVSRMSDGEALAALRVEYRALLLGTACRDLAHGARLDDVAGELADLADGALEAALAIARASVPDHGATCRIAVIAMGKCGGRELNYISDVDVIFVAEPVEGADETEALKVATKLATGLMRACSVATPEGALWEVDPALRPEGKQGVLVRTLRSHVDYYERWAKTWEFQALLKARVAAGDLELGAAYVDALSPMVWQAAAREGFVPEVQAMRRRVEGNIPSSHVDRQLKLGPGGLRDVEFAVQLLQLVHGRSDVMLRSATTLVALEALATWGYVGLEDASTLGSAYRFLRTLEHRIQVHRLTRTHMVPESEEDLRRIGRSLGFRYDPVAELTDEWRRHAREVRRLHEKLFYRPLLNAVARLDAGEARLTPEAARDRLEALGYVDPAGALRHIEALTSGVSRRAAIQRTLLPVLLGWFADAPDPDAGLLAFRRVSDTLGATPWYLRLLRDESSTAERMAQVLSSSRFATDLLLAAPEAVSLLADESDLVPRTPEQLRAECTAAVQRAESLDGAAASVRGIRRRELFRLAAADVLGIIDAGEVGRALSDVTDSVIAATLGAVVRAYEAEHGAVSTRLAVIGMGRLGGAETGFASDADVMFVHDPLPGVDEKTASDAALQIVTELRRVLSAPSPEPPVEFDADLRPEGRQGPLVRSLASYAAYYERWSSSWEAHALVRARPVAGDSTLCSAFLALIDPLRWPKTGLSSDAVRDMRRLKARMESERLPRGADPTLHTKLGRGGLSDVEWTVQMLQMQNAAGIEGLRSTSTITALRAAGDAGLLDADDVTALEAAWMFATQVRDASVLAKGTPSDLVPTVGRELAGVAYLLGYRAGDYGSLVEDYRRVTRRARVVMERVFYG